MNISNRIKKLEGGRGSSEFCTCPRTPHITIDTGQGEREKVETCCRDCGKEIEIFEFTFNFTKQNEH